MRCRPSHAPAGTCGAHFSGHVPVTTFGPASPVPPGPAAADSCAATFRCPPNDTSHAAAAIAVTAAAVTATTCLSTAHHPAGLAGQPAGRPRDRGGLPAELLGVLRPCLA